MKKAGILFMLLLIFVAAVGCGSKDAEENLQRTVTVTLPRAILGTQSDEEIEENAAAEDVSVSFGDDDTVIYTMTPEQQQELLLSYKTHFEENLQTIIDEGEIPGLVAVDYNDDMSVFTVTVNREAFQENNGDTQLGLFYSIGATYQLYAGKDEGTIDVVADLLDQANGEEFASYSMREAFNEQQSYGDSAD